MALVDADLILRVTAAGTAQVFHLIPLHQTHDGIRLPIPIAKVVILIESTNDC